MKIITGGQTGVDTGALLAAEDCGAEWQAIMPRRLRREKLAPDWMVNGGVFGDPVLELPTLAYDKRTERCVYITDAVLIVAPAGNLSPGTRLTIELAKRYGRSWHWLSGNYTEALTWLRGRLETNPKLTLMVAGPRESKWPTGELIAREAVSWLLTDGARDLRDTIRTDDVDSRHQIL
jgi:hypothetical protein